MVTVTITIRYIFDIDARTLVPGRYSVSVGTDDGSGHYTRFDNWDGEGPWSLAEDEAQAVVTRHLGLPPKRRSRPRLCAAELLPPPYPRK